MSRSAGAGTSLPLQVVFECPRLADLAARISARTSASDDAAASRLVPLQTGRGRPVFCWPGLGGYPMNLRLLGREASDGRAFYGVQAHGINEGETPYATIRETAAADVAELCRVQPEGPYTLWGYSFGARVAFEAAWQLEQAGQRVEELLLICPGNPEVRQADGRRYGRESSYANPGYVTILFSVFAGAISGPELERCLAETIDESTFVACVHRMLPALGAEVIRRNTRIVGETYEFEYSFRELAERRLAAPVTVLTASGDDYFFIEGSTGCSAAPPTTVELAGDHYGVLKEHGVLELAAAIRAVRRRVPWWPAADADTLTDGPGSVTAGAPSDRDGSAFRRTRLDPKGLPDALEELRTGHRLLCPAAGRAARPRPVGRRRHRQQRPQDPAGGGRLQERHRRPARRLRQHAGQRRVRGAAGRPGLSRRASARWTGGRPIRRPPPARPRPPPAPSPPPPPRRRYSGDPMLHTRSLLRPGRPRAGPSDPGVCRPGHPPRDRRCTSVGSVRRLRTIRVLT
ncbi:hypothetical protein BG452_31705 [Streptomyces sp. CBMA123]|nr:hypothetical protein [Streptomyces sp. CBMA123]